ncbi:TerD family protein [Gordonia sp. (in: high G+C Gram-positive bacteria)]|uniref:TerD family protein n=1 Tax=Gordonia sp. (in: high G+C Gram-positive bacteria) TaxID=84139 RepID=UPI0016B4B3D8|nr:TerD family protein [Gordonia sp. (in: high G+C Gram-positive bacteria)]NLG45432.1 TerD family protein [Gordonia sp. (in: high G+C Gram-positive bacteria)]
MTIEVDSGGALTTDASVLLLEESGRVRSNSDFVFYNQPKSVDGSVQLLEREPEIAGVCRDTVAIRLDRLPAEIDRVVIGASVDDESEPFGTAEQSRMTVAHGVDAEPLVVFPIDGLTDERALVFAEVYRRGPVWKVRAVGQGYEGGLAALVTEFGVEVNDPEPVSMSEESTESADSPAEPQVVPAENVRIKRRRRTPKLPADWRERVSPYLPTDPSPSEFHRARAFPTAGTRATDQEERGTSILLAMLEIVREFGRAVTGELGAPGGRIETFVEPTFTHDGAQVRPDGMICVTRGSISWTALVEVKTGTRRLDVQQVETYLAVAKARGFDAVVTISPELQADPTSSPLEPSTKLLKTVRLHHLAWEEIVTTAALTLHHTGIDDRTRERLLHEFLTYATSPASGMAVFDDMGRNWVSVREAVRSRTVGARDATAADVCENFDRLIRHAGLQLSAMLGQKVQAVAPAEPKDAVSRVRQLADSGKLFGTLRMTGLVGPMIVEADLARERTSCAITVAAPKSGRASTHVTWLLKQLEDADPKTRLTSHHSGTREATSVLMEAARTDPSSLVPVDGRDIREFTITVEHRMGSKRAGSSGGFVKATALLVNSFYDEIACRLKAPTA